MTNGQTPREMTLRAILLGTLLSVVLGAANCYLGLYAGMTVSASIPAAVISMAILRGLLRTGSVLENNIVQTIASSGESLAAGVIFTVPALVITEAWHEFQFWPTTLITLTGGLLGVLFMIPLRRALIVEERELRYPEGTACAEVLRAGEKQGEGGGLIFASMLIGALFKFLSSGLNLIKGGIEVAFQAGRSVFYFGSETSLALLSVGYIVGLNIGTLIFLGGVISWVVGIPLYSFFVGGVEAGSTMDSAWTIWKTQIRFVGVGAMAVGGLWTIYSVREGMRKGLRKVFGRFESAGPAERTDRDMSRRYLLPLLALMLMTVFGLYRHITGSTSMSLLIATIMVVASFVFVAVASYIVGLVGSSNSPVSGMTICALLFAAAVLYLFGFRGTLGVVALLGIAGVVCCATCTSGDVCQDLKTGYLVGATPWKQQFVEIIGTVVPAFFFAPILTILHSSYGIGIQVREGVKPLVAPQAMLFSKLSQAFFTGQGELPMDMVYIGMAVAILVILLDSYLKSRGASFRTYIMAVAVGIYLPLQLSTPIFVGGLIHRLVSGRNGAGSGGHGSPGQKGLLVASGLIAGESLMGVLIAGIIFAGIQLPISLGFAEPGELSSLVIYLIAVVVFARAIRTKAR